MTPPPGLFFQERRPDPGGRDVLVVLVHGTLDRSASFAHCRRELADLRIVTYDRRGYGRSRTAAPPATTLDDHVADLLSLVGGRPCVVAGHSYGGDVALRAGQRSPEVVRALVVFEAPLAWLADWPSDTSGGAALRSADPALAGEAFLRRMIGDDRWEALPERAKADRRAEGAAVLSDMRSLRPGPGQPPPLDVGAVTQPVVVGTGDRSSPHLHAGARQLAALLRHAELHVLPDASHGAHSGQPGPFAALVRRAVALSGL